MPGGNGRVLAPGDDPRSPTAHLAKDVWVVGHPPPAGGDRRAGAPAGRSRRRRCRRVPPTRCSGRGGPPSGPRRSPAPCAPSPAGGTPTRRSPRTSRRRWATRMAEALRVGAPFPRQRRRRGGDAPRPGVGARPRARRARRAPWCRDCGRSSPRRRRWGSSCRRTPARVLHQIVQLTELFDDGAAPIDVIDDVLADAGRVLGHVARVDGARAGVALRRHRPPGRTGDRVAGARAGVRRRGHRGSRRRRRRRRSRRCSAPARASSPTAARIAATSSWRPRSPCCSTTATTRGRSCRASTGWPSTSPTWSGRRARHRSSASAPWRRSPAWRPRRREALAHIETLPGVRARRVIAGAIVDRWLRRPAVRGRPIARRGPAVASP